MRNTITIAFVALAAAAVAAQSQQPSSPGAQSGTHGNATVVTGCLSAGPNNTFTLTAPDPNASGGSTGVTGTSGTTGSSATTPVGSKVIKTVTYTLSPNGSVDLKSEVGHQVQVSGSQSAPQASTTTVDRSTGTAGTPSTSGATPTVETTAQAQIVARTFNVDSVKRVADKCDIVK